MDLVTVTCLQDLEAQRLQCASIKYVTNPTRHWVIVNEPDADLEFWHEQLAPYYANGHRLMLRAGAQNPLSINGWVNQQWLKFGMSLELGEPYLVLDSKNFFCKWVDARRWLAQQGSGYVTDYTTHQPDRYTDTIKMYSKIVGAEYSPLQWGNETPWLTDPDVVRELMNIKQGWDQWFVDPTHGPSEFLLYSIWQQAWGRWHAGTHWDRRLHNNYWPGSAPITGRELNYIDTNPHIYMLGLHRAYLKEQSDKGLEALYNWLRARSLPTGLIDEQTLK